MNTEIPVYILIGFIVIYSAAVIYAMNRWPNWFADNDDDSPTIPPCV